MLEVKLVRETPPPEKEVIAISHGILFYFRCGLGKDKAVYAGQMGFKLSNETWDALLAKRGSDWTRYYEGDELNIKVT